MKATLYYFTSTGNSLFVARNLAKLLQENKISTEIISIPKIINTKIETNSEIIGLIFPVFCWGLPRIVSEFIKNLPAAKNKYVFAITTYGGFPGATLKQAAQELKEKNIELKSGFALKMPGNYTPLYGPPNKKDQEKMFFKAQNRLNQILPIIVNQKTNKIELSLPIFNWIWSLLYKVSIPYFPKADQGFWVTKACNGCGICAQVCPTKNIILVNKKPLWQQNCEHCLTCLHWCPEKAIQFKKVSITRERYHHPEIKLKDLLS